MTETQVQELAGYVREIGELKTERDRLRLDLSAAVDSMVVNDVDVPKQWKSFGTTAQLTVENAALRQIARELAAKCVRGKTCLACGTASYMGSHEHNGGCAVSRLQAFLQEAAEK